MTKEEIAARIAELKRKLKAREHMLGYGENVEAVRKAIADLEAQLQATHG